MTDQDFDTIRALLREQSANVLDADKRYMVEARLAPLVRARGLTSIAELVRRLRSPEGDGLAAQVVEAMMTAETSFFRDRRPFEELREVLLPDLLGRRRGERRLNIWCAACSTGQEPYSVALLLREHFPELSGWRVSILGSDLSRDALSRARAGRYSQIEVDRGLPAGMLEKYFEPCDDGWQLRDDVRGMVEFQAISLARPWPPLPRMDLVLLRNALIYFDADTKRGILAMLARLLRPDGYLLLGGAETTFSLDDSFRRVEGLKSGFFQLCPDRVVVPRT
jgi:chemotaxis protein methyltransferase CheR